MSNTVLVFEANLVKETVLEGCTAQQAGGFEMGAFNPGLGDNRDFLTKQRDLS